MCPLFCLKCKNKHNIQKWDKNNIYGGWQNWTNTNTAHFMHNRFLSLHVLQFYATSAIFISCLPTGKFLLKQNLILILVFFPWCFFQEIVQENKVFNINFPIFNQHFRFEVCWMMIFWEITYFTKVWISFVKTALVKFTVGEVYTDLFLSISWQVKCAAVSTTFELFKQK